MELVEQQLELSSGQDDPWATMKADSTVQMLQPLLEKVFSVTATSAPVERVFSQGGLTMRPNRTRHGKQLLCDLVFLKCNSHL